MKLNEIAQSSKPIVLVFGRICSGKGTFCKLYTKKGYHHITTSDVVKKLSGVQTRDKLQDTKNLDTAIGEEMINIIKQHDKIIIDGIRQTKIVDRIIKEFGDDVDMVWLEATRELRKERFTKRGAAKDDQSFEDAERGDSKLGLDDVEAKYKSRSRIIDY